MKKILIQKTNENHISWGAEFLNKHDNILLHGYPDSIGNGPITFKEISVNEVEDEFSQLFYKKLDDLCKLNIILNNHTDCHLMTVGVINSKKNAPKLSTHRDEIQIQNIGAVELIPTEDVLKECYYFLSYDYYYGAEHEWKRLAPGDKVSVVFSSIERNIVFCQIQNIVSSTQKQEDEMRANRYRLSLDLSSMAGHALLGARLQETNESTNVNTGTKYSTIRLELNGISLFPDIDRSWIPEDILGNDVTKGCLYNTWLNTASVEKSKQRMYDLSVTRLTYGRLERFPKIRPEQDLTSVEGVVASYNKGAHLLWVLLDGGLWSTCVFRNNIIQEGFRTNSKKTKYIKDDMNIWGPLVREYLPLGFPAIFHLEFRAGATNTRLFLSGFNPGKLKGRVSSPSEAQNTKNRVLKERILVSPYARKENGIMLTCAGYAGYASNSEVPKALLNYCDNGIFTTEMKIPARIEIVSSTVIFSISSCLHEELSHLSKNIGNKEFMKICAISLGKVYLTTKGGYPIEYICNSEEEEIAIREMMFKEKEFTIEDVVDGWVSVSISENFEELIKELNVPIGGLFIAEKGTIIDETQCSFKYKGLKCQVIQETLDESGFAGIKSSPLLLVGINNEKKCILAAARHDCMAEPVQLVTQIAVTRQLLPQLWLGKKNNQLFLMKATLSQSYLLKHLQSLYGNTLSVQVDPINVADNTDSFISHCKWSGMGCGSDYRALFSNQNIKLQLPLSTKTPKVLYYDVILTAEQEELNQGPMRMVVPTGQVTADGAFVCRRGNESETYSPTAYEDFADNFYYEQLMGTVVNAGEKDVTLKIGNEFITMNSEEQLHIPIRNYAPLCDVFTIGSEWSIMVSDEGYELNNACPNCLIPYELVKESRTKHRRGWDEWVVRGEYGQIAVANVEHGEEGDILLMVRNEDTIYNKKYEKDSIVYVMEAEELLIGQKVPMYIQKINSSKDKIECQPVDKLTISDIYEIPLEKWNWNATQQPLLNIDPLKGSAFMAKIIRWDDEEYHFTALDRRCLIPQCELMQGKTVNSGFYQMYVTGYNKNGYILTQNDVSVNLSWDEAAFCSILWNNEVFIREFLRKGTLMTVYLEEKEGKLSAYWRSRMGDKFKQWMDESTDRRQKSKIMKVHHVGTLHLFLEYDGILMYADASQFGKWDGYKLENDFQAGQFIYECYLRWDEPSNSFCVDVSSESNKQVEPPQTMSIYTGEVVDYLPNGDCRIIFGPQNEWATIVKYFNLTWEPYPKGKKPYPIGMEVKIKVLSYNEEKMKITASVKDCLPRPKTGPASEKASQHPELRFFTLRQGDSIKLQLLDEFGVNADLHKDDADVSLLEIKDSIKECDGVWLPVIGASYNRYICSQIHLKKAYEDIKQKGIGQQLECIIRDIQKDKRLIVSTGVAIGRISHLEATGQHLVKPTEIYKKNQTVKCIVTSFDDSTNQFIASIVKTYPRGLLDMLPNIEVGKKIKVEVISADSRGALVQLYKSPFKGIIPASEISHIPNTNIDEWSERYTGELLDVVCILINPEKGVLNFSRKQAITPEAELL